MTFAYFIIVIVLSACIGCSMDYGQGTVAENLSEEIPNSVLFDVTHTLVSGGRPVYIIRAGKAEAYHSKNLTIMYTVLFQELNEEGEIITEGWADEVRFQTDTENAELFGNIEFYSSTEEAEIRGSYLEWNSEVKTLSGGEEGQVYLQDTAGSTVTGKGFIADFRKKRIDFSGNVEGTYVEEKTND